MKTLLILLLSFSSFIVLFAQETSTVDRGKESQEEMEKLDQGSNLERKQYREISEKYRERIANGIKLLTIVSANFGEEVPDSKTALENIIKENQIALRYYYRNAHVASGKSTQKVDKDLTALLGKFAKVYDTKTQNLLTECADSITKQEQTQLINDSQDSSKSFSSNFVDVTDSTHKLKIAYNQLSLALDMARDDRFYNAIIHFRIAKDYGIKILTDLKEAEADKKAVTDKYVKDLADNRNMISGGGSSVPKK